MCPFAAAPQFPCQERPSLSLSDRYSQGMFGKQRDIPARMNGTLAPFRRLLKAIFSFDSQCQRVSQWYRHVLVNDSCTVEFQASCSNQVNGHDLLANGRWQIFMECIPRRKRQRAFCPALEVVAIEKKLEAARTCCLLFGRVQFDLASPVAVL